MDTRATARDALRESIPRLQTWRMGVEDVSEVVKAHALVVAAVLLVFAAWVVQMARRSKAQTPQSRPPPMKQAEREYGNWMPHPFVRPRAPPVSDPLQTKPIPYRPFRHGPKYAITMGLRPMEWDSWIELDSEYPKFHAAKAERILERGPKCCKTAPEAYPAALELLDELSHYCCERFPDMYAWDGDVLVNKWSGERLQVKAHPLPEDPMMMAARLVQDDLALMIEKPDGIYYLLAGAILLPGFWRLEDKFGMPLSEIHTSGDVPGFKEKLERGMINFFRRLKPESPMLRNNYFIQVDDKLGWSDSIGNEDGDHVGWDTAEKGKVIEHHWFRSERQSLRRLPKTGAVLFTIRTYFVPMTSVCDEPYVPGRLASAVRSWGDDVAKYKGRQRYGDVLLEYLDKRHEEQVREGLEIDKEDDVRAYPY